MYVCVAVCVRACVRVCVSVGGWQKTTYTFVTFRGLCRQQSPGCEGKGGKPYTPRHEFVALVGPLWHNAPRDQGKTRDSDLRVSFSGETPV